MILVPMLTLFFCAAVMVQANWHAQPRGKRITAFVMGGWLVFCGLLLMVA